MTRFLLLLMMIISFSDSAFSQKKVIAQARTYIKSGKDLEKAEKLMADLLKKDSANRLNEKIWLTYFDAVKKQYEQGNEKLYLKQKYDTTALFNITKKMFIVLQGLDTLDAMPDKKGVVHLKYRARHAEYLASHRPNIYNGGTFHTRKGDYQKAFTFFDMYLDADSQPIFTGYDFLKNDTLMPTAAYWATYCGYRMKNDSLTLKYAGLAEKDTARLEYIYQYEAETYKARNDTAAYVSTLRKGFYRYPKSLFFFPRLIDYYNDENMVDSVSTTVDYALAIDSTSQLFRFAESTLLLNTGNYDESIRICQELIAEDDSLADAHYNIGVAYFNQAIELDKVTQRARQKRRKIQELYEKARPYIERYRALAPDEKEKWVPVLYTIYLNLNMGKEFDEIDRVRMKMNRK